MSCQAQQQNRQIERERGRKMILKYKLENGSWRYITLTDFVIGKVDITEVYNKYLDKETGKFQIEYCGYTDDVYELTRLFERVAYYPFNTYDIRSILRKNDIVNKHMNYTVISYNKDNNLILYNEAYLMSDSGKTIEKLM